VSTAYFFSHPVYEDDNFTCSPTERILSNTAIRMLKRSYTFWGKWRAMDENGRDIQLEPFAYHSTTGIVPCTLQRDD